MKRVEEFPGVEKIKIKKGMASSAVECQQPPR
jgi:hypothetical protein